MSAWLEKYDEINDYLLESPIAPDPDEIDTVSDCICDTGHFYRYDGIRGAFTLFECDDCGEVYNV